MLSIFEGFILLYSFLLISSYILLAVLSIINIVRYKSYNSETEDVILNNSAYIPGVSVIAPAYNEEKTVIANVHSLLTLKYPLFEVVIVNDGSKDKTLEKLIKEFELVEVPFNYVEKIKTKPFKRIFKSKNPKYDILTIVDKENGGTKADASNAGINASVFPYFLCTDVDCILQENTLTKMIVPFLKKGKKVVAVGATLRMVNSCELEGGRLKKVKVPKALIPRFQELEYMRAYLLSKFGWSLINCVPNVSGGLGMFDKEIAIKAGGYDGKSHAEDMDMVTRMRKHMFDNGKENVVDYIPLSCCWTEGPPDRKVLGTQRTRWSSGLIQLFTDHRKILFNPKYKLMGLVVYPYAFLFEFLAPIIEALGLFVLIILMLFGQINWAMAGVVFLFSYSFAILISLLIIILDNVVHPYYDSYKDIFKLIIAAILEPFIYHPLIVFYGLKGYITFLRGKELNWGSMTRAGLN